MTKLKSLSNKYRLCKSMRHSISLNSNRRPSREKITAWSQIVWKRSVIGLLTKNLMWTCTDFGGRRKQITRALRVASTIWNSKLSKSNLRTATSAATSTEHRGRSMESDRGVTHSDRSIYLSGEELRRAAQPDWCSKESTIRITRREKVCKKWLHTRPPPATKFKRRVLNSSLTICLTLMSARSIRACLTCGTRALMTLHSKNRVRAASRCFKSWETCSK